MAYERETSPMDPEEQDFRRASIQQQQKIDELIESEPDQNTRVILMVMSNINKFIAANTELVYSIHKEVKSLKKELDDHITATDIVKHKGEGMYQVIRVIVPVLWITVFSLVGATYKSYSSFHDDINQTVANENLKLVELQTIVASHIQSDSDIRSQESIDRRKTELHK